MFLSNVRFTSSIMTVAKPTAEEVDSKDCYSTLAAPLNASWFNIMIINRGLKQWLQWLEALEFMYLHRVFSGRYINAHSSTYFCKEALEELSVLEWRLVRGCWWEEKAGDGYKWTQWPVSACEDRLWFDGFWWLGMTKWWSMERRGGGDHTSSSPIIRQTHHVCSLRLMCVCQCYWCCYTSRIITPLCEFDYFTTLEGIAHPWWIITHLLSSCCSKPIWRSYRC